MKHSVALVKYLIYLIASFLIIVICSSILVTYFVTDHRKTSKTARNQFVWSDELRDWTWALNSIQENSPALCIWPEDCPQIGRSDRIIDQLSLNREIPNKLFKILPPNEEIYPIGQHHFISNKCPVNKCLITRDYSQADAVIFSNADVKLDDQLIEKYRSNQVWIAYLLESPANTFDRRFPRKYRGNRAFNWTATYRSDSDIVTPYSKYLPNHETLQGYMSVVRGLTNGSIREHYKSAPEKHKILIKNKSAKVAWFVSNCNAKNNRLEVALELSKYIQVDIYGKCGNLTCSKWNEFDCLQMINENYKYYLAFENSNNRDYVTEKLFKNALGYNNPDHLVLPIVLGPSRQDYERLAPPKSFIHVDDFESLESLADHLKELDRDEPKYYSYFQWKSLGQFIDSKFLCRVCAMLHENMSRSKRKSYPDIQTWWLDGN